MFKFRRYIFLLMSAAVSFLLLVHLMAFSPLSSQIYYSIYPEKSMISCYRVQASSLQDISEIKPKKDKSIFFHETSCNSHLSGKIVIAARQACAVESAAKMNPNRDVYLLFTSPGLINLEGTKSDRILEALLSYKNIRLNHLDYKKYTKDTPVQELYNSRKLEHSSYALSHASDILRYLTLWKYGGIYLDLDVVVVRSFETLPLNFAGAESDAHIAAGALGFGSDDKGRRFALYCLDDLRKNFRGNDWGNNGPGVITRLLQNLCQAKVAKDMITKDCEGFHVYSPEFFYPVAWWNWTMYFSESQAQRVMSFVKNSYAIHVWNKHSSETKITVGSKAIYPIFAQKYCPKVYAQCNEYF